MTNSLGTRQTSAASPIQRSGAPATAASFLHCCHGSTRLTRRLGATRFMQWIFIVIECVFCCEKKTKTKQKPPVHLCVDVCMRAHMFALVTGLALFAGSSRGSPANLTMLYGCGWLRGALARGQRAATRPASRRETAADVPALTSITQGLIRAATVCLPHAVTLSKTRQCCSTTLDGQKHNTSAFDDEDDDVDDDEQ